MTHHVDTNVTVLDIGRNALDQFFRLYSRIETIQFFGGEPLLNCALIKQLCEHASGLAEEAGVAPPVFSLITNGSVVTTEIIELIRQYDVKVTVSLDGPPHINDLLRVTKTNGGTSRLVEEHIHWLKEETGQPIQIEGTFTRSHIENNCSVGDVLDYIAGQLKISYLHMPIDSYTSPRATVDGAAVRQLEFTKRTYADATAQTIRSLAFRPVSEFCVLRSALDILEALLFPQSLESPFICPAGNGTIAVDSNGDVYPCFMFYRRPAYRMGSVVRNDAVVLDREAQVAFLREIQPVSIHNVSSSWARPFFHGCAGSNFFRNGHHAAVSNDEVAIVEAMVTAAVVELAHLSAD